jgi:hypothetical protein
VKRALLTLGLSLAGHLAAGCGDSADDTVTPTGGTAQSGGARPPGSGGGFPPGTGGEGVSPDTDTGVGPGQPGDGRALYASLCASCHGASGEGGAGPALTRPYVRDYLVDYIDASMPLGRPELCDRACAEAVADYVLAELRETPRLDCAAPQPGPRALRLLNRREWLASVRALFATVEAGPGVACDTLADCDWARATCADAVCVDDPCPVRTFVFDPAGRSPTSVHVAGSFNDWAPTIAAGGWPLTLEPDLGRWLGKFQVPDGEHAYKLVVDEREWLTDPENPRRSPDGFGGQNALLTQRCADAVAPGGGGFALPDLESLARNLPAETRPKGYPYDTHAEAAVVTTSHIEAWLQAGRAVAAVVEARAAQVAPCLGTPGCGATFVEAFVGRAFRAPLEAEVAARYRTLFAEVEAESGPAAAVATVVEAVLSSPLFLYRSELGSADGDGFTLSGWELAEAMAYAFWGTPPDAALRAAGLEGRLSTPEGRAAEAERLLADPRAEPVVRAFAEQWLGIAGLGQLEKRADLFPGWSPALSTALLEESRRFVAHVMLDPEARFPALLTADYTFANGLLRAHYGLQGDRASTTYERTPLNVGERAGVLGHGAVLAVTAHSDQTSPIRRGLFVRERLLCTEFGAPPPDAGGVPEVDPNATTRERFRQHTAEARCAACHQYIDDVGFGFEAFDAVGAHRDTDLGRPLDTSADMNDVEGLGTGTSAPFGSLPELGRILADSERAEVCFATQAWRFVRGRLETHGGLQGELDRCEVERALAPFRAGGGDVRALLVALVSDPAFARRAATAEPTGEGTP